MRKITAIALLITLFLAAPGYHLAFRIHLRQLKAEIKRNLRRAGNRKDVMELAFTTSQMRELEWEEEHEFRWNGEMYDVIEKRTEQDKILIRCIADKKEKLLLEEYQKNIEKNQGWGKASLVKLLTANYLIPAISLPAIPQRNLSKNYFSFSSCLCSIPHAILTPPPKFADLFS